ncbi:MOG interacting and ectopic P-granules protein 1 [Trichostrongylus colubriformis]|uniref:MOG interacting and ectopic P-granules protein 1 n=1 Tax=Trichostrongylus colubriformis TaxID=6319 RepID=A0AAN8F5T3_TRICO
MVTTMDESVPTAPSSDESSTQEDQIQKLKDENRLAAVDSDDSKGVQAGVEDKENGEASPSPVNNASVTSDSSSAATNGGSVSSDVECIELDEEAGEPPAKKLKGSASNDSDVSVINGKNEEKPSQKECKSKEKEAELTSPGALLNKLEEYVSDAIDNKKNIDRKVLDALLGAINVQVQKEPLSVRKLILDKQLVLPNTISFPPSLTVDMLIEHDPDHPLSKVITRMFGEERPKLNDTEKKERQTLKLHNNAPHMTKLLLDIGQDLVQESTYCDIVHARNLPETPKNIETYKQVAAQLKPVWEALRKRNEPYKMKMLSCQICGFKTESRMVLQAHRSTVHFKNGKYQCAMCPEFDTNEQRLMNHYLESHLVIASKEEAQAKYPCLICDEDFQYKGLRDTHLRTCKKDYSRVRNIMGPKGPDDQLMINRWLWERPPIDPTILQQQQAAQQQQKRNQLAQAQQAVAQAALRRTAAVRDAQQNALQQQLLQQQQRMRQAAAMMQQRNMIGQSGNSLIAAMQQHIQRANQQRGSTAAPTTVGSLAAATALYQKNLAASRNALLANASALRKAPAMNTVAMQKALAMANGGLSTAAASGTTASAGSHALGNSTNAGSSPGICEICDQNMVDRERYFQHLQLIHKHLRDKTLDDVKLGAPLACSRCRERFWTYEGLERHLVMAHGLVTADLLAKAQNKLDGGRCKLCAKQYAFNMLQHLVADHHIKLCSAEIMYSCDVCSFKCSSYTTLESHLNANHPKGATDKNAVAPAADSASASNGTTKNRDDAKSSEDDCITLE